MLLHALERGLPLDLVLGGPGLEDLFLSRAVPVRLGDVTVPVISPEDVIVTKVLGGRPKDLDDVHGVLCGRLTSLDVGIVRGRLRFSSRPSTRATCNPPSTPSSRGYGADLRQRLSCRARTATSGRFPPATAVPCPARSSSARAAARTRTETARAASASLL